MKLIRLIAILIFVSFNTFSQKDYTFCYSTIAVSMLDGGKSVMVRYDNSGKIVSQITGEFDLYGKGGPTEILKIKFQGNEYRYDLIRDGLGIPSIIIDNQGRKYNICKSTSFSSGSNETTEDYLKNKFNSKDPIKSTDEINVLGYLAVTKFDVGFASWHDAIRACEKIGNGWHLPNFYELYHIYKYKGDNKLSTGPYWSSTQAKIKHERPWGIEFEDGAYALDPYDGKLEAKEFKSNASYGSPHTFMYNVRAVKVLSQQERDEFNLTGRLKTKNALEMALAYNKEKSDYLYFYRTGKYSEGFSNYEISLLDKFKKGQYSSVTDSLNVLITPLQIDITIKGKSIIVSKFWTNQGFWENNEKFVKFEDYKYLVKFYFIKGLRKENPNSVPITESDNIFDNNNNDFAIDKDKKYRAGDIVEYKALPQNAELQIINKQTGEISKLYFLTCQTEKFSR